MSRYKNLTKHPDLYVSVDQITEGVEPSRVDCLAGWNKNRADACIGYQQLQFAR